MSKCSSTKCRSWGVVLVCFLVVLFDQLTKWWILQSLQRGEIVSIVPRFFNLTLTFNRGAAFGILSDMPDGTRQLLLGITTLIALSAVLYFLRRDYRDDKIARLSLALIFGGAVGNVLDRFRLGEVVDFLDVYWQNYHWPAFNVADSAICVGVFVLIFRRSKACEAADKSTGEKQR